MEAHAMTVDDELMPGAHQSIVEALADLYEAWTTVAPEAGKDELARTWRERADG